MRRVLLLIKGLGRGGAEQLVVSAVRHADRSRFRYEVAYLLPEKDAFVGELRAMDAPVTCLGIRTPGWIAGLRTLVRERDIDLVHIHSPLAASVARVALPRTTPIVYTEHNMWERYHPATRWANMLTYPRNGHAIAVSDHVRSSVRYPPGMRFRRMPPIETIYHGPEPIDTATPAQDGVRAEFGIPDDAPIVGTVANFKGHKGYPHLIAAAKRVRAMVPNVRFMCIGVGPYLEERMADVRTLGLRDTVIFTGFREDVQRLVSAFDVFALASLQEGLSIALIEAMTVGKPVVVTNVGGLPEVVTNGAQGFVVPPSDPGALAEGIVRILRDPDLRAKFGSAAAVRGREFDIAAAVRRTEEIYAELLP